MAFVCVKHLLCKTVITGLLLSVSVFAVFGQSNAGVLPGGTATPTRRALIVGNGAYERQPLANPTNDARALAQALEETGFEVLLRTDRTVEQMEDDLRSFREVIQPGDVTLFFYAGHGVQVDGRNYLLPIDNGDIQDNTELRRKAIDAHAYVETMVDAGAELNIVMLDACRDNPLPAATRGGNRGLSAMDPPRGSETVIVFATQAGDVAEDGDGDNSTFTTALLQEIHTPDVELLSLFNRVGSDVREETGGKQVPTIYSEPLSEPFYFVTREMIAARARAESNAAQAEVDVLEDEIAAYQARIEAAADERERRELEVEQQRQQALLAAQRIEAQNLEEEAARREREAREAEERRRQQEAQAAAAQAEQEELARLASARRQEMERLAEDARSEDPDILIATIERLEAVLEEVESEYDAAWRRTRSEITASFRPRFAELNEQEPEIWETDEEFNSRIRQERTALRRERTRRINATQDEMESQEEEQTAEIRGQLEDALATLRRSTWTLKGSDVELEIGEYDRNARQWAFTISSTVDWLPLQDFRVVEDFSRRSNPREAIIELNDAVEAGALAGEIVWKIERDEENERYLINAYAVGVRNIVSDRLVEGEYPRQVVAGVNPGTPVRDAYGIGTLSITSRPEGARVYLDGSYSGTTPVIERREFGSVTIRMSLTNHDDYRRQHVVRAGEETDVTVELAFNGTVGDRGPAGGIIFYDKGNTSDGWRYLEAAPSHIEVSGDYTHVWGGRGTRVGNTGTAIGTGAGNTDAIIAEYGASDPYNNTGNYAARLADRYEYGGYDDWFLPSKDELNEMYQKKEEIGGFASNYYWSSSEYGSYDAWTQIFYNGNQNYDGKGHGLRVRAARAF